MMKSGSGGNGYLEYSEHRAGQRRQALIFFISLFLPFAIILHIYFSYSSVSVYTTTTGKPLPYNHSTQLTSSHASETAGDAILNTGGQCDLFRGDWIPEPAGPFYTNKTCRDIPDHQNCMKNGRPDSGYLYWKWKPDGCHLPRFNASRFLHIVRNKVWGFIGDSIARNNVQSLVCLLSQEHYLFFQLWFTVTEIRLDPSERIYSSTYLVGPNHKGIEKI